MSPDNGSATVGRRIAVGVDIGGTKIAAGAVDESGTIIARAERPADIDDAPGVCAQIAELVSELGVEGVLGLGLGVAGIVDHRTGYYFFGPNTGLRDVDLGAMAAASVRLPTKVDNDANCAAWAEHRFGMGRGCSEFMCVTLGTGIGGGIVLNGKPYRGAHGGAAEIGHIMVDPDGPQCGCGRRGCWEQFASGLALERLARERLGEDRGGREITAAARAGDARARGLVDDVARWVGIGLGSLVNILEPERIAIAGGVVRDWDLFADVAVAEMLAQMEADERRPHPVVGPAELGADAGVVGAALLILDGPG